MPKPKSERIACNLGSDDRITLLAAGSAFKGDAGRFKRHPENLYIFEYVTYGAGRVTIHDVEYHTIAGDVYILPRDTMHLIRPDDDDPWGKKWFCVRGTLVETLLSAYSLNGVYHVPQFKRISIFNDMMTIAKKRPPDSEERIALAFHAFLIYAASRIGTKTRYSPDVASIAHYLDTHVGKRLKLERLEAVVPRSRSQILRRFRAETGTTPYQYHMHRKLEQAKVLLSTTAISIHEIAAQLSFTDQYHFSNTFKKRTGVSPERYRNR